MNWRVGSFEDIKSGDILDVTWPLNKDKIYLIGDYNRRHFCLASSYTSHDFFVVMSKSCDIRWAIETHTLGKDKSCERRCCVSTKIICLGFKNSAVKMYELLNTQNLPAVITDIERIRFPSDHYKILKRDVGD